MLAHGLPDAVVSIRPPYRATSSRLALPTAGAVLWANAARSHQPAEPPAADGYLGGCGAFLGSAVVVVRVVRDMHEFDRVQPGDIVVCPTMAAAWSPIFGVIAGLVTEHGGLLSHPAILAREYGLPAVLGVPEATVRLADGSRVEVDGGQGTVTPL